MEEDVLMALVGLMLDFTDECTIVEKVRVPDGEGGWNTRWADGMSFRAAIVHDTTLEARVAESEGMGNTYTVTTEKSTPLDFHDVFRRVSDGQVFRVKSDARDVQTPKSATFQICQVEAEEWVLPS